MKTEDLARPVNSEVPTRLPIQEFFSDEKLQLITGQIFVGHGVLIAYQLGMFKLLINNEMSVEEIADSLNLKKRAVQALVSCASSLDIITYDKNGYKLTPLGQTYFNERSPHYYGYVLDLLIQESRIMSFESIRNSILTNLPQASAEDNLFSSTNSLSTSEAFIAALHHKAFKPAFFWSKIIKLADYGKFVDIGGGSGVHTIAACLNNPALTGVVCDRDFVVPHAKKYIEEFALENRIIVTGINIWEDALPHGDVYFLGDIFHDWQREKCLFLAKKCFDCLPKDGRILIHEMLFDEDKTGPFLTAAYNMKMMLWTEGQQYSYLEIRDILIEAGFRNVEAYKSLGNWSIITGVK